MNEKLQNLLELVRRTAWQAGDLAADAVYGAGQMADDLLSSAKLRVRAATVEGEINGKLAEVGEMVYATHTGTPTESEELLAKLQERGINSTQATISRDIKQMHLIKQPAGQGVYKYAVSDNRNRLNFAEKLRTIFRESITSIDYAQNIVVIKTMPGLASAACSALDNMDLTYMVGSLAGDDTAFLLMKDTEAAETFCEEIKEML